MKVREAHPVRSIISLHKSGSPRGIYSVCSSNELVLEAAFVQAAADDSFLLVESTCNQVNQFGGYTGMTPASFAGYMLEKSAQFGFPRERLILGGDHLGPTVWKGEGVKEAMNKARDLVKEYVEAGFSKIHLDASAPCADDPLPLPDETVAARSAELCRIAEDYGERREGLVYVVGTEVPVPGGVQDSDEGLQVTAPGDAEATLENARRAFTERNLDQAWERVVALVVQPGVEFGNDFIVDYDREKAASLSRFIEDYPGITLEAHSTDYQKRAALRQMVEDNFTILKVGPWLTFAFREGIQALCSIEEELFAAGTVQGEPSRLFDRLEQIMMARPGYWENYYPGSPGKQYLQRRYSFSDRARYYWQQPEVEAALVSLFSNLGAIEIPLSLLSFFLPSQYQAVREGLLSLSPRDLVLDRIREVLRIYSYATIGSTV